jgi:tetratricopeptide (TPR) repeat protein
LQQCAAGFHKKFFTCGGLTSPRGFEKMARRMQAKSNPRKKSSRANQRDLDVKIEFMEGIVRRDPDYADALQLLGDHYTRRGRFPEGLNVDERLARLEPENPLVFYNLACSYSLTEQFDRAARALEKALSLGYRDFAWLAKDPDLKKLRAQPGYRDLTEKIQRLKKKAG